MALIIEVDVEILLCFVDLYISEKSDINANRRKCWEYFHVSTIFQRFKPPVLFRLVNMQLCDSSPLAFCLNASNWNVEN
jgi:hypothetical protein